MNSYLASQNRTVSQMNNEERNQYQQQVNTRDRAAGIVADALVTVEKFCQSMRESFGVMINAISVLVRSPNIIFDDFL